MLSVRVSVRVNIRIDLALAVSTLCVPASRRVTHSIEIFISPQTRHVGLIIMKVFDRFFFGVMDGLDYDDQSITSLSVMDVIVATRFGLICKQNVLVTQTRSYSNSTLSYLFQQGF